MNIPAGVHHRHRFFDIFAEVKYPVIRDWHPDIRQIEYNHMYCLNQDFCQLVHLQSKIMLHRNSRSSFRASLPILCCFINNVVYNSIGFFYASPFISLKYLLLCLNCSSILFLSLLTKTRRSF